VNDYIYLLFITLYGVYLNKIFFIYISKQKKIYNHINSNYNNNRLENYKFIF
jgi:hypothetical protein